MNLFLIVFAVFYLAEHAIEFFLTFLNLSAIRQHEQEVPGYFRDKITLEQYQRSIAYNREKARLGTIESAAEIPFFWGLLLSGSYACLDGWVRSFHLGTVLTGLFFFAAVGSLFFVFSLPFSLYSTFVIEQKYGFNRTTWRLWTLDLVKGILLSLAVGGPILAGILWLMERFLREYWWMYVWSLLLVVQILVQAIFPVVIVPLFNRLTPLPDGNLREQIEALAKRINFRLSGIFTMDGSKRSNHSNAFFAGIGRFRRIVLFDTLISTLNEKELLSVLAHEMGHNVKKHVRAGLLMSAVISLGGLYILSLLIPQPWFCTAFKFSQPSSYAALFVFVKTVGSFVFFLSPLASMLSRKHEYEADRFAAEIVGDHHPMIQSLVKLTSDNLSNLTPHPLYSFFYYSHPTVMERINALERVTQQVSV